MVRKSIWLMASCLMVLVLVLASCGPAEEEEEEGTTVVGEVEEVEEKEEVVAEEEGPEMVRDSLGNLVEKPRYGGWLTIVTGESGCLDPIIYQANDFTGRDLIFEGLCVADWARGPFGTNEHAYSGFDDPEYFVGLIAESWEIPDLTTLIFNIRRGIHWNNRPPVNGRELVADDVVYSLIEHNNSPLGAYPTPPCEVIARDKYTVVVNLDKPDPEAIWTLNNQYYISPPEITDYSTYKNVIGTGPYILTDFVSGSSATLERNPDYWRYDPLHPENQLPYTDGMVQLCIQDASVSLAALRTRKVDIRRGVQWQQVESLKATNPELQMVLAPPSTSWCIFLRDDIAPYDNIKVRRALSMAIDREAIKVGYWGGAAEIFDWPIMKSAKGSYTPLDEMPIDVQENYSYNPEKAKQLLSEAGAQNLKVKTIIQTGASYQEVMSLVVEYWSQIGVETQLELHEPGPFWQLIRAGEYGTTLFGYGNTNPFSGAVRAYDPGLWLNFTHQDDPYINERRIELLTITDASMRNQVMREMAQYEASQCWVVELPGPCSYNYWQPWVHNYGGWDGCLLQAAETYPFIWIDQELKKTYTGQ